MNNGDKVYIISKKTEKLVGFGTIMSKSKDWITVNSTDSSRSTQYNRRYYIAMLEISFKRSIKFKKIK